jgi:hypothetical protein
MMLVSDGEELKGCICGNSYFLLHYLIQTACTAGNSSEVTSEDIHYQRMTISSSNIVKGSVTPVLIWLNVA